MGTEIDFFISLSLAEKLYKCLRNPFKLFCIFFKEQKFVWCVSEFNKGEYFMHFQFFLVVLKEIEYWSTWL